MAKPKSLRYLDADCTLTLRQGIAELRTAEGADDAAGTLADDLTGDLDIHDAIHVLFGCPTNLAGEIVAHVWTAFGTTYKLRDMHRVNAHRDHRQVIEEIGHWRLLRKWLWGVPQIVATLWRTQRMKRRWPVEDCESFLDRPLNEVRHEFGIRLPKPSFGTTGSKGAAVRFVRHTRASVSRA